MNKREELEEKYYQYQFLEIQLRNLIEQREMLNKMILELEDTERTVEDLNQIPENEKIMVPLGSGVYGSGQLKEKEDVLVSFGGEIIVKKKTEKAKEILEERKKEVEKSLNKINTKIKEVSEKMEELQPQIEKLASEMETR
jgi:prefoldin alpha subunit